MWRRHAPVTNHRHPEALMTERRPSTSTPLPALGMLALAVLGLLSSQAPAHAENEDGERYAVHGQFTYVEQETSDFTSPYRGPNSLSPRKGAETTDATIYAGMSLWRGAEGWINGEIDQGFGLDNTLGVAGFPSAEAYKVGKNQPYLRLPRLFVRQTIDLGAARVPVDAGANQLAGSQATDRLVFTVGKMGVSDIFDTNRYAHDQRADFLNWTAIDAGTFDYAADAWGYTVGAAAEWYQASWALRAGLFDLSNVPNSTQLEPAFHEFQTDFEIEKRLQPGGRPGKLLLTVFDSRGRMGSLDDAVARAEATQTPVDIASVRRYRSRTGASLSVEQEIASGLGFFARVGKAGGNVEVYEFTDVDRTAAAGLALQGVPWHRGDDTLGVAAIVNGISAARQRYLNAGGLGILVGDGRLPRPGPEQIMETYYSLAVFRYARLTLDYQWIGNPAYNRDRGPVSVFAVRV